MEIVVTRACHIIVRHLRGGYQAELRLRLVAQGNAIALLGGIVPDLVVAGLVVADLASPHSTISPDRASTVAHGGNGLWPQP